MERRGRKKQVADTKAEQSEISGVCPDALKLEYLPEYPRLPFNLRVKRLKASG